MAGKIYLTEEEYRTAMVRRNETRKSLSGIFVQLGTALIAAGAAEFYVHGTKDPLLVGWFLVAIVLILIGLGFLRGSSRRPDWKVTAY
jgi:hypothetical protein